MFSKTAFDPVTLDGMLTAMNETISPTVLLGGAMLLGIGLYFIQRGRFLMPALMRRSTYLRTHQRTARYFFYLLVTFGVVAAGAGCRVLYTWLRG